jgi:uncharacterized protein YwqG
LPDELAAYRATIEASRLEYVRIRPTKSLGTKPWESKFLGHPYLPKASKYPVDVAGQPLALLAQINFSELPPLAGYPTSGLLQFFISGDVAKEHVWGLMSYEGHPYNAQDSFQSLQKQSYFRVIYHPSIVSDPNALESEVPKLPSWVLPISFEARLRFEKASQVVAIDDYRFQKLLGIDPYKLFETFGQKERSIADGYFNYSDSRSVAQIGGYGSFVQEDPRTAKPDEDWVVLLGIRSGAEGGEEILWGDVGAATFLIRRSDLSNRDFSKVAYYWDNH